MIVKSLLKQNLRFAASRFSPLAAGNTVSTNDTVTRSMAIWPKVRPRRVRMITMDITGTIVSFKGTLEEHYLGAAKKCGVHTVDPARITSAFGKAYKETSHEYPCFGGDTISAKRWWRLCVNKSFKYAGCDMDEHTANMVFQRIYSRFGSNEAYHLVPDALPFLQWARRQGLVCGVLSNADERYGDSILPMLGLSHDELQLQVFSKDLKMEKPDPRFFLTSMERGSHFLPEGGSIDPSEVLHIGNDFEKDFEGAREAGMHAVLLDRYNQPELAEEWRRQGAPVFVDLLEIVEFLGRSDAQLG